MFYAELITVPKGIVRNHFIPLTEHHITGITDLGGSVKMIYSIPFKVRRKKKLLCVTIRIYLSDILMFEDSPGFPKTRLTPKDTIYIDGDFYFRKAEKFDE